MKKLLIVILAVALIFSFMSFATAFADETVPQSVTTTGAEADGATDGASEEDDSLAARATRWLESKGIPQWLIPFIVSLLPILELRGGIIAARIVGMKLIPAFLICFIGNMLPLPFVLLFIKKIFAWLRDKKKAYSCTGQSYAFKGQFIKRKSGNFSHFSAADAGSANFLAADGAVIIDLYSLDVGFKHAGRYFHNVHTDTAFFLGKTATDDPCTVGFLFAANFTYITH
jgi:hypothetical protein